MLIDELKKAQMEALKTKDTLKRSVLQIVTGKVKLAEIEKRTKNETITDDDVLLVINKVIVSFLVLFSISANFTLPVTICNTLLLSVSFVFKASI